MLVRWVLGCGLCLVLALFCVLFVFFPPSTPEPDYWAIAKEGDMVLEAINRYKKENGRLPRTMGEIEQGYLKNRLLRKWFWSDTGLGCDVELRRRWLPVLLYVVHYLEDEKYPGWRIAAREESGGVPIAEYLRLK